MRGCSHISRNMHDKFVQGPKHLLEIEDVPAYCRTKRIKTFNPDYSDFMISTTSGGQKLYNKPEHSYVVILCDELVF